jgi:hypothetical protein
MGRIRGFMRAIAPVSPERSRRAGLAKVRSMVDRWGLHKVGGVLLERRPGFETAFSPDWGLNAVSMRSRFLVAPSWV